MKRRVVITGLGVIAPNGIGKDAFWEANKNGKSGIGPLTRFDASKYRSQIAGEVKDFNPLLFIDSSKIPRMDRATQFAIAATKLAVQDAKLELQRQNKDRIGIYMSQTVSGVDSGEKEALAFLEKGNREVSPYFYDFFTCSRCLSQTALEFDIQGHSNIISTGCGAGTDCIGQAFDIIRGGEADIMLAVGTEAPLAPTTFASFDVINCLSSKWNNEPQRASRPFDKERDGFVMSEGAATLILEELEHAVGRGANIYGELIGYGASCNAYHMAAPEPEGRQTAQAILRALRDAAIKPEEVDYFNAHGSSTPLNEKSETKAIKIAFGKHAYNLAISSSKSICGHLLGASGMAECLITVLALQNNIAPPTINYEYSDPECDLDCIPNFARAMKINVAVSNSCGFAGLNYVLVMRKFK